MDALGAAADEIRQPRRHIGRRLHWLRSEHLVAAADSPAQRLRRGAATRMLAEPLAATPLARPHRD
jgi:hypothetical protein